MEVIGRLNEASLILTRQWLGPFFARHALQLGEFDVVATLRRSGAPYRLTPTQLYETMMISSGGMTNRLDRLEKAGLIERQPNPEDRRGLLIGLTEKGLGLVDGLVADHVENEKIALAGLSEAEQKTLADLLRKLLAGLDREE